MSRKRILIIDEEEDFCGLLKLNIDKTTEYEAWVATSGGAGLDLIQAETPDLALLDIMNARYGRNGNPGADEGRRFGPTGSDAQRRLCRRRNEPVL